MFSRTESNGPKTVLTCNRPELAQTKQRIQKQLFETKYKQIDLLKLISKNKSEDAARWAQ